VVNLFIASFQVAQKTREERVFLCHRPGVWPAEIFLHEVACAEACGRA
jgi:hypothetical protein